MHFTSMTVAAAFDTVVRRRTGESNKAGKRAVACRSDVSLSPDV